MLYWELSQLEQSDLELEYGSIMTGVWPEDIKIKEDLKISPENMERLWERIEHDYEIRVNKEERSCVETIGDMKKIIYEYMCII